MKQAIKECAKELNRLYGAGAVRTAGRVPERDQEKQKILLDVPAINHAIGGGIPRGSIVEIYGGPNTGKTDLALSIARASGTGLLLSSDGNPTAYELRSAGELCVAFPRTLEDALRMISMAAPAFDAVVLDSLAAFPTKKDCEHGLLDMKDTNAAEVLSHRLPAIVSELSTHRCTLVIVTQEREKPYFFGPKLVATGGRALGYFATLRLRTSAVEPVVEWESVDGRRVMEICGQHIRATVEKAKCCVPFRTADYCVTFASGLVPLEGAAQRVD